jgi:hypothetical protein
MRSLFAPFALLVGVVSSLGAAPAKPPPTLCTGAEKTVFGCAIADGRIVSVCTSPDFSPETGWIEYRFGRPERVELAYPPTREKTQQAFEYTRYTRPLFTELTLQFTNGGYLYRLQTASGDDDGTPIASAILDVRKDGRTVSSLRCQPEWTDHLMSLEDRVETVPWGG